MNRPLRVYLVRHARAEASHRLGDAARRLTPDGRAAFRERAASVAAEARLAVILTSPFRRARETAELLAASTGAATEIEEALAAGRTPGQDLVALACARGDGTALVGHNPEIADAVAAAGGRGIPVPPGTIACVEVEANGGRARVVWVR